jgi:Zn-dependent peptidase ImmA (M78 family)
MDYTKIKAPYIINNSIKDKANKFREKYWDNNLPINIENIIDVNLKIDIIPLLNLEKLCNANALITSSWESLYIDKELFEDERRENRLRFSLAHEIGHFILHKDFYSTLEINSFERFYKFINDVPNDQYRQLETQANKFAGHFLVPRELLVVQLEKQLRIVKEKIDISQFDEQLLKAYLANPLSKIFGISDESMEIVLSEYDLSH